MRSFDYDYFKKPLNRFSHGQCTWYVWGRTYEMNNIALELEPGADAGAWLTKCTGPKDKIKIINGQNTIKPFSIAVFPGHVVYIEYYSDYGDEAYVTFSGANDPNYEDGELVSVTADKFKSMYRGLRGIICFK